jgi:hypothetical protein
VKLVTAARVVEAPGIEVEQLWFDKSRWASWIDGFSYLVTLEEGWPLVGERRVYDGSGGRVLERVITYSAGSEHASTLENSRVTGIVRVRFETDNVRTRITLELDVEPKESLAPGRRWWLRRKLGESLALTLQRFSYELAADR